MISDIQFNDLTKSKEFSYAAALPFFKANREIAFKPGLNIMFGPNGCGKSTILRMAALCLAAEQGGISTLTQTWLSDLVDWRTNHTILEGIKVRHDGTPVLYGNPRNAVGLFGGGAAFDDDFFEQGLNNIQSKASTGYTTIHRLDSMVRTLDGSLPFPKDFDDRIGLLNPLKGDRRHDKNQERALELLAASIPKGQRTLIFDEPESGLGLPAQGNIFDLFFRAARANDFQIIIATHSAFALGLPETNYIEMSPKYLANSENALSMVQLRFKLKELERTVAAKRAKQAESAQAETQAPQGQETAKPKTRSRTKKA